jgi:hypothetical protein
MRAASHQVCAALTLQLNTSSHPSTAGLMLEGESGLQLLAPCTAKSPQGTENAQVAAGSEMWIALWCRKTEAVYADRYTCFAICATRQQQQLHSGPLQRAAGAHHATLCLRPAWHTMQPHLLATAPYERHAQACLRGCRGTCWP